MDIIIDINNIEQYENTYISISIKKWYLLKNKINQLFNTNNKMINYIYIIQKLFYFNNLFKIKKIDDLKNENKKINNEIQYNKNKKFGELTTKNQIYELLKINFDLNTEFKLKDVYLICEGILSYHHPNNTIQYNLQKLRDDGYLIFINRGVYSLKY